MYFYFMNPIQPITIDEILLVLQYIRGTNLRWRKQNLAYQSFAAGLTTLLQPNEPLNGTQLPYRINRTYPLGKILIDYCLPIKPELARFWQDTCPNRRNK